MRTPMHFHKSTYTLIRIFLIGILILSLSALFISPVRAASVVFSTVNCTYGNSVLQWSGELPWAWGKSWGWLWHWEGSGWGLRSSGYAEGSGSSGYVDAGTTAASQSGYWTETGAHQSSFFDGTANSYSDIIYCP